MGFRSVEPDLQNWILFFVVCFRKQWVFVLCCLILQHYKCCQWGSILLETAQLCPSETLRGYLNVLGGLLYKASWFCSCSLIYKTHFSPSSFIALDIKNEQEAFLFVFFSNINLPETYRWQFFHVSKLLSIKPYYPFFFFFFYEIFFNYFLTSKERIIPPRIILLLIKW